MHSKATKINLQQGLNELFTDPNVEKARDFFQTKSRAIELLYNNKH